MTIASTVHVDGVDVIRSQRHLLRGIDLRVEPDEHWVVLGPNGAGKSALLNLLAAHTQPTRGSVHVLGRQLSAINIRELRTLIGHVNPRHRVDVLLTATEVVWTGLMNTTQLVGREPPRTEDERRATELLTVVGMGEHRDLRWAKMSQGKRVRVLIARALVTRPRLLLLDEPATGLDVAAREDLLSLLDDLCTDTAELTTLMVAHHFEEIPASTTHALLIRDGRSIAAGPVEQVLTAQSVSTCFSHPLTLERSGGRWIARSHARNATPLRSR